MQLYGIHKAAKYLKLSVTALRYHIASGHITPEKVGHSFIFTQDQLDEFQQTRRPQGRPKNPAKGA